jgi:hypothetical protein
VAGCTGAVLVQRVFSGEKTVAVTAFEIRLVVGRTVVHVLIVAVCSVEPTLAGITVVRHLDEELSWRNGILCSAG